MRIDSMYAVTHGTDAVCPQCGKVYYKTEEWAYKCSLGKSCFRIFCSWSCMRAARAAYERKAEEARMERVEKRKGLPRYVTSKEKTEICRMYASGWSALEISDETGRSMYAVQSAIKEKYGCYIAPPRRKNER